jgi:hypothetical protein
MTDTLKMVYTGMAKIIPRIPAIFAPAKIITNISRG